MASGLCSGQPGRRVALHGPYNVSQREVHGQLEDGGSVVAKAGQYPIFRYHLGMAYWKAGNSVGARQQLVEAVGKAQSDYPGLAEARATRARHERALAS